MTTGTDGQNLVTLKSEAGHSSNTVSSMSCNSAVPEDGLIDEKFLMSKFGHSQMDIYLSREDLVQKLLFAAVAGNGEQQRSEFASRRECGLTSLCKDEEYIATFLIVYRRFKSPYE